ncbi:F-box/kelch-repeat protein At3g06240-like [Rutidosis leptorrhynchoides]|uniref:F-box/kelch-repeat protein At3g06240-like n=1 Tax=Rutidosis leptorrhynchoides TaxID=125765 RepID=UPI003A99CF31
MEIERNLSMTKRSLLKSIVGDTSRNASIHDLSDYHIVEILVRLPVKTIVHCKFVCRDWLNLITNSHFITLQLPKSPECFMLFDKYIRDLITKPKLLRLEEIEEEHGRDILHHDPIMRLDLNRVPSFQNDRLCALGSVNGLICLICLSDSDYGRDKIHICNPITGEYMILPEQIHCKEIDTVNSYGFGVSSLSGEYKVIRIFHDNTLSRRVLHAEIYTLGTGKWRSLTLGHVTYSVYGYSGTFLNNHIHWNIHEYEDPHKKICTFDIDNETFQLFPSPPVDLEEDLWYLRMLGVLDGCLCYSCYCRTSCVVSIWVMKEYGIGNSWQKKILITESISPILHGPYDILCFPMGSFKDGRILMMSFSGKLLVYHPNTHTIEKTQFSDVNAISYRPSFVKLQNFESESVHKFPLETC